MALKGRVGARALMSILYNVLWEAKYNLPGSDYDIGFFLIYIKKIFFKFESLVQLFVVKDHHMK
jgi:ATP-dependent protease Clp ATPase subunit